MIKKMNLAESDGALVWMQTIFILDVACIDKEVVFGIHGLNQDINDRLLLRATPEQAQVFLNRLQDAIDAAQEV